MAPYKYLGILTSFIFCSTFCLANRIDSLKTDKEVLTFVKEQFPEYRDNQYYFDDYSNETIKVADSLNVKKWVKIDFDQNGETDILIFNASLSSDIFMILSKKGKYQKVIAHYDHCKYQFMYPVVARIDSKPVILLYNQFLDGYDDSAKHFNYTKLTVEIVTYFKGNFLNYLNVPKHYHIENIKIHNDGVCEGTCPLIDININAKAFKAECYKEINWDSKPKKFKGQLSPEAIREILIIFDYSNFTDLNEEFNFSCTDQPTTTLTVKYNNGQIKTIRDYGSSGNFTLTEIYRIANNIKWGSK